MADTKKEHNEGLKDGRKAAQSSREQSAGSIIAEALIPGIPITGTVPSGKSETYKEGFKQGKAGK